MKLEINLDDGWLSDYEEHISDLIKSEIDVCIQREVKQVISEVVKDSVDALRERLAKQMRELSPKKLDEYLTRISREGL